jgi:hypothetical protein
MAKLILPAAFIDYPGSGTTSITLEGVIYLVRLVWNNRVRSGSSSGGIGAWFLDLRTSDGTAILVGLRLVLTEDLWAEFKHLDNVPQGKLSLTRPDGTGTPPGLNDLGTNVRLDYTA